MLELKGNFTCICILVLVKMCPEPARCVSFVGHAYTHKHEQNPWSFLLMFLVCSYNQSTGYALVLLPLVGLYYAVICLKAIHLLA